MNKAVVSFQTHPFVAIMFSFGKESGSGIARPWGTCLLKSAPKWLF